MSDNRGYQLVLPWLNAFWSHLQEPLRADSAYSRMTEIAHVITDCSNEQYLNALAAEHLRSFGRETLGELFWARCEWTKVDVSYGEATEPFSDWDRAWPNRTGDLGQIEVKLTSDLSGTGEPLRVLKRQLCDRKRTDDKLRREHRNEQTFTGLVWHWQCDEPLKSLDLPDGWKPLVTHTYVEDIGRYWPRADAYQKIGISLHALELDGSCSDGPHESPPREPNGVQVIDRWKVELAFKTGDWTVANEFLDVLYRRLLASAPGVARRRRSADRAGSGSAAHHHGISFDYGDGRMWLGFERPDSEQPIRLAVDAAQQGDPQTIDANDGGWTITDVLDALRER